MKNIFFIHSIIFIAFISIIFIVYDDESKVTSHTYFKLEELKNQCRDGKDESCLKIREFEKLKEERNKK